MLAVSGLHGDVCDRRQATTTTNSHAPSRFTDHKTWTLLSSSGKQRPQQLILGIVWSSNRCQPRASNHHARMYSTFIPLLVAISFFFLSSARLPFPLFARLFLSSSQELSSATRVAHFEIVRIEDIVHFSRCMTSPELSEL